MSDEPEQPRVIAFPCLHGRGSLGELPCDLDQLEREIARRVATGDAGSSSAPLTEAELVWGALRVVLRESRRILAAYVANLEQLEDARARLERAGVEVSGNFEAAAHEGRRAAAECDRLFARVARLAGE